MNNNIIFTKIQYFEEEIIINCLNNLNFLKEYENLFKSKIFLDPKYNYFFEEIYKIIHDKKKIEKADVYRNLSEKNIEIFLYFEEKLKNEKIFLLDNIYNLLSDYLSWRKRLEIFQCFDTHKNKLETEDLINKIEHLKFKFSLKDDFIEGEKEYLLKFFIKDFSEKNKKLKDSSFFGLPTGFNELDKKISGFQPGWLVLVAGRPGMGKTNAMVRMMHELMKQKKTFAFFSLEMTKVQIMERFFCLNQNFKKEHLNSYEELTKNQDKIENFISFFSEHFNNSYIHDKKIDIEDLVILIKSLKKQKNIDCVFVDYLQLIDNQKDELKIREIQIRKISSELKKLAVDLNIPIIAGCQLNRGSEKRVDKRPLSSDLRESGSLEQDADLILGVYRDLVPDALSNYEVLILKNRFGDCGKIEVPIWF
jgi:replicative DNA helicase